MKLDFDKPFAQQYQEEFNQNSPFKVKTPAKLSFLHLKLTNNNLESVYKEGKFLPAFQAIPDFVRMLYLQSSVLGFRTKELLLELFKAIPSHIQGLSLASNHLDLKGPELPIILQAIPNSVRLLDLTDNHLGHKTAAELIALLQGLPAGITELNLRQNGLCNYAGYDLASIFRAIPAQVKSLNLAANSLDRYSGADLAAALSALPPTITELDLSDNDLDEKTNADLVTALAAIPSHVRHLQLRNNFYSKSSADLVTILKAIPTGVSSLDLSTNHFMLKDVPGLSTMFQAIPGNVRVLALCENGLDHISLAFPALPAHIHTLKLNGYDLYKLTDAQITASFQAIPATVTTVDLSGSRTDSLNINSLITVLSALPATIKKVTLGPNLRFSQRSPEEQHALRQALKDKSFYLEGNGSDIQKPVPEELDKVLPRDIRNLVLDYMLQTGENLQEKPVKASFWLCALTHPVTKVIACVCLMAGILAIALAAAGVGVLAMAITGVLAGALGAGLLTAGFFAKKKLAPTLEVSQPELEMQAIGMAY